MSLLNYLLKCSLFERWIIFLFENVAITILTLIIGQVIIKKRNQKTVKITKQQWRVCGLTNVINTIITYFGFWLWLNNYIHIKAAFDLHVLIDFVVLFFAMDFLMFVFHYIIHHSGLYKAIHYYHHLSINPTPIDLFILHPLETFAFGGLWLILLLCYPFNLWAIAIYLITNVIFGMAGHLGSENKSSQTDKNPLLKYIGTSSFHHNHHKQINYNYGFYTSIWDRLFGTYAGR